ncbi:NAD(P)/FAD-dependent oxidoreductase [Pseudomarimonas salicorniae]|uniref:Tryptophan 7-halogenase n=1 Tax=Pseudomarimonas salicorniae TaxID=2933270 RepID=A0ABT0GCV8_9GAMM|nr:tryptophan 7-halogenase [Lysobacter sp. CAU 1642]MCK7592370.1 tryptophan 7-halogenase [Lysobacter sp. CAU 1642]
MPTAASVDALILGGGLAGLTLALQLRQRFPELRILVVERRPHPVPEAAHKVGESTVEIGAHYFADALGLREHLERCHIRKFGFRFFFSDGHRELDQVTELGVRRALPTPAWQIDRGIFENFLGEEVRRRGIEFRDAAVVRELAIGGDTQPHRVVFEQAGARHEVTADWLLDASGRAGLIKRRLGLAEDNAHNAHAVWFRLDRRLKIDDWCDNPDWRAECEPPERWRSTNHLVGPGYWVWLIPLSSGAHSVGIVADPALHPLESMNSFERALDWLRRHQPLLADHVEAARKGLLDFAFFRKFSYRCKQVFSADRWALTGEAGVFLDPFYSPGSDFIAIANTYIVELVARQREGASLGPYARLYEQLFQSFYENTLSLYQDQYPLFGNAEVFPNKVLWDYAYYWGVLCQLVFQHRLTDLILLGELRPELEQAQQLNARMQSLFRAWDQRGPAPNDAVMLDQGELDWFHELNRGLHDPLDDDALRQRLRQNVQLLERLAQALDRRAGLSPGAPPQPDPPALFREVA